MDTLSGTKPPQPPATTAGAETAAVQSQILKAGTTQKDDVAEIVNIEDESTTPAKKAAGSPLSNYFVSTRVVSNCQSADCHP
jgi:hypothetical protein